MRRSIVASALVPALGLSMMLTASPAVADHTVPVDPLTPGQPFELTLQDSGVGGAFDLTFVPAYTGSAGDRDVYIYAPDHWDESADATAENPVAGITQGWDPTPGDEFLPCTDGDEHVVTQDQIDDLGDSIASIVAVDEAHFGPIEGDAPFVVLVYNVPDESFYQCDYPSFTAGYFAPDLLEDYGINVVTIDSYQWSVRLPDYKGTIAHELEHLLHGYADSGELSWVDEGLADFAQFLTGYGADVGHTYYHQVFHRETSLTKWGGGLEDYGASYTFFQYLWEQAGGADGVYTVDILNKEYTGAGGDLFINMIFNEQENGVLGVQNAIDAFNAAGGDLPDFNTMFANWAVAIDADVETSDLFDLKALDMQTDLSATPGRLTIDWSNEVFYDGRGQYQGNMNPQKWDRKGNVPDQTALAYGLSYETFRNPGPNFSLDFSGSPSSQIAPFEGDTHAWGGYTSQADNLLNVAYEGGTELAFATWYFIEEGWDFGYVEVETAPDVWEPIDVFVDGVEITTDDDPFGNNEEGNGITGTSGGEYFVDEPVYVNATATIPAGATDVRFRYSTDAAYLDTGWFIDAVTIDGGAVGFDEGDWIDTTGEQANNWLVQVVSMCDITPNHMSDGEIIDGPVHVYRFTGTEIHESGFDTGCLGGRDTIDVIISNQPSGDLTVFDAEYDFQLVGTGKAKGKNK